MSTPTLVDPLPAPTIQPPPLRPGTEIVLPTSTATSATATVAPALEVRPGLRIALLSNGKVNGSELLAAIGESLREVLPDLELIPYRKPSVSVAPDPDDLAAIVAGADAAICAIGDCGSCSSRTMRDAIDLEWLGVPSVAVIADALVGPVDFMKRISGMDAYTYCTTPFPVGNLTPDETRQRGAELAPQVLDLLTTGRPRPGSGPVPPAATEPQVRARFASDDEATRAIYERRWTDGLPVVLPTPERVAEALVAAGRDADEVVIKIPTRNDLAVTAGVVAANAVMAGCEPHHLPLVMAAVEALGDPRSNLHAHTATLSGAQQVLIVNGPGRARWGINSGEGALGPGTRANAAVGRALRLVIRNGARSIHGEFDRSTFGHPGRYSWCFGEGEEHSPWPSLAADAGLPPGTDAVSLYATVWQASTICHSRDADELLDEIALSARTGCHVNWLHGDVADDSSFFARRPFLFVTGRQHAEVLVAGGHTTKEQVRQALFDRLTAPHPTLRRASIASPDHLHLVYVHGTGFQQTLFFAPFQSHELVTVPVATPAPATVTAHLAPIRQMLLADGFDLAVHAADGSVHLDVSANGQACAECLVPAKVIEAMARDALAGTAAATWPVTASLPGEALR
jgi:hypothetical protein